MTYRAWYTTAYGERRCALVAAPDIETAIRLARAVYSRGRDLFVVEWRPE